MTSSGTASATGAVRGNLVIAAASVVVGVVVIPYGASMPYIREGIPGPGLFPMMIGGLLILFGILLALTSLHGARRERRHLAELAAVHADGTTGPEPGIDGPTVADDLPASEPQTAAALASDIGSDGIRRWINGAVLMGGIIFYVLFAEILGFPLTMALLVFAIVWSLRAKWWVALATGVCASLGLWAMFELALMVQLPDGILKGF
ncbi:tripartite tricarboxylate transporter TctB family protein [Brachybacterium sp. FME24]|uniref:tripartite tricarboxylate transporter TctB family protein n=1 Tax=Brachybacterium sp. FME24 TaxID=2742605 RepID=UPI001867D048|nr:tripartite tricarboxylate transporter TctB family protein [Brachybacterium sp. FME24]